jgi:hypothetical protein
MTRKRDRRDAACIKGTEWVMTRNLQSTTSEEELQRATDGASAGASESNAPIGRAPQARERQRRPAPAPAANRPVATPVASGLSKQPQPSIKPPADFDRSSSREALIATAAYYRAQSRGFLPGHDLQDWLAAEREIDRVGTDGV